MEGGIKNKKHSNRDSRSSFRVTVSPLIFVDRLNTERCVLHISNQSSASIIVAFDNNQSAFLLS